MTRTIVLLVLFCLACMAPSEPLASEDFRERLRSVTPQNFDSGGAVARQFHLESAAYLEMTTIARTGPERPLPEAFSADVAELAVDHPGGSSTLAAYVAEDPFVDGVVVLHEGRIVFEAYPRMAPWQRHFSWSVSKVVTSTALGALVAEERVDMDEDIANYLPDLAGTAWAGTSVRDVANMASGIACLDADGYQTPTTCIYRLEEALGITAATGYDGGLEAHFAAMERHRPAGERYEYVSANTNLLGMLVESVEGRSFAEVVQERIWGPMGAEADGLVAVSPEGFAYASGGVTLRLRDLARFGELLTRPAAFDAVTAAIVEDMQGPHGVPFAADQLAGLEARFPDDAPIRAGWQWDLVWADGAMFKGGYSGQGLYVDPGRDLIVAFFGTGEDYSARRNALLPIARQLARSGLFDRDTPLAAGP